MKKLLSTVVAFAALWAVARTTLAFETAQPVNATPITAVPFTITASGNYYLPADLNVATGTGITVNANQVVIDLNGRSLNSTGGSIGINVTNHDEVTIQNGDIDGFSTANKYAILLNGSANGQNQKNLVRNVNFDNDWIGVLLIRGSIDEVEHCNFDGGVYGCYDILSDGGDRFQACNSQNQTFGIVSVSSPTSGNLIEDCLFANESAAGFLAGNSGDRFRFNTAVNGTLHIGGIMLGF
jgi:hypothetical protein